MLASFRLRCPPIALVVFGALGGFVFAADVQAVDLPGRPLPVESDPHALTSRDARWFFDQGIRHYRAGRLEQARDALRSSVERERNPGYAYYLGLTYARLGDPHRAARYLNRALRWEPPLAESYRERAGEVLRWAEDAEPGAVWTPEEGRYLPPPDPADEGSEEAGPPALPMPPHLERIPVEPLPAPGPRSATGGDVGHPEPDLPPDLEQRLRELVPHVPPLPDRPPSPSDLTGSWIADDGARYFVRQIGDRVYWYCESAEQGAYFANVYFGRRVGNRITGEWIDVPRGGCLNYGWLEVEVLEDGTLRKVTSSSFYGASSWKR